MSIFFRVSRGFCALSICLSSLSAQLVGLYPACPAQAKVSSERLEKSSKESKESKASKEGKKADPAAYALGQKVLEAIGGYEKFKAFNDKPCRASGKIIQTSGLSGNKNAFDCQLLIKREKEKITISMLGQPLVTVYDGKVCWTQQGDTVVPADAITAKRIEEDINHGLLLLESLHSPNTRMELGKPQTIDGRACDTLIVYFTDGKPTNFAVDKETHLVLASSYPGVDLEQGLNADKTYHYADYRKIEGTMQPYKVLEYSGNTMVSETQITEVAIDNSITDDTFRMPVEKMPVRLSAGAVSFPFEYSANEILVRAKINGSKDLKFILDTGATQSILDASLLKKEGANMNLGEVNSQGIAMTTGAGSIQAGSINLKSLTLGDMELNNVPVAVADLSTFDQVQKDRPAGLIGANILKRFLVTVDYENSRITLEDPNKVTVPDGAIILNTKPSLGMAGLAVEGSLDGKNNISFLIDTGAAFNNISETKVKNLVPNPLYRIGMLKGLDGKVVETGAAKFEYLDIDKLRIDGPVFSIAPANGPDKAPSGIITSGDLAIIGNPLLSRYKVTFDYRNQRLILTQSKSQKAFYEYQGKIAVHRLELIKNKNVAQVVRDLENLANQAHNRNLPNAEALVRCELALALCQKNGGDFTPDGLFRKISADSLVNEAIKAKADAKIEADLKASPQAMAKLQAKAKESDRAISNGPNTKMDQMLADSESQLLTAYNLAQQSGDKNVQARVLATWGYLYASQNPTIDYLSSAKQKIGNAVTMAPADAEVLAASGYFLSRLESVRPHPNAKPVKIAADEKLEKAEQAKTVTKTASADKNAKTQPSKGKTVIRSLEDLGKWLVDQIVDQSIMTDPANWLALWTKLDRVKAKGNMEEVKIIQAQLKHYYPNVNISGYLK